MKQMREGGRYDDINKWNMTFESDSDDDVEEIIKHPYLLIHAMMSNDELKKKFDELLKEFEEYTMVKRWILTKVKGGGRYDDILPVHYRQEDDLFSTKAALAPFYSNEVGWD